MVSASGPHAVDALNPHCKSRRVLELIADKWTVVIVYALSRGTARFSELERSIGNISQKMLAQTLRTLEREGIVERTVYPTRPPQVDYALTPLGQTLFEAGRPLCEWAEERYNEVEAAQFRYDEAQRAPVPE